MHKPTMINFSLGLLCDSLFVIVMVGILMTTSMASNIALPNCPEKCGNISVPYPFGIGKNCYYTNPFVGSYYNLTCNNTNTSSPSLVHGYNIEVLNITLDGQFRVLSHVSYACYGLKSRLEGNTSWRITIHKFPLSTTENSLLAIGCDTFVWFSGAMTTSNQKKVFRTGCMTLCNEQKEVSTSCSGVGCCKAAIPSGVSSIKVKAKSYYNHTFVQDFNPCSVAFPVASDEIPSPIDFISQNMSYFKELKLPVVFNWSIANASCKSERDLKDQQHICKGNSSCIDMPDRWGYRCQCNSGFRGNPYLHDCQDIDECAEGRHLCKEPALCINTMGSYSCTCPRGYSRGNGTMVDPCIPDKKGAEIPMKIRIICGIGGGIIVCFIVAILIHWQFGNNKQLRMREAFFHQNGGHILQQKLLGRDVSMGHMVEMFTVEELKKATNNYSESSIVGRGGFGIVFKGTLTKKATSLTNQIVAIKRSLKVDSSQVEQFINEIVALSQINNKNVVKLLGCCLETEVPLLVYEYISNGTLYDHLHDERKVRLLTWDIRLRIATEVSEVLAYLHSTICIPIIHRDIKSANILLDASKTAKVSDFGASKLSPTDQEQLASMVQGTCGYLDPEYMQSGELTEKSDVYSFGVVLVELLTKEKAICYAKTEAERCLAVYFLRKLKEDRLFEILDNDMVNDDAIEQLKEVANLARRCLKLKGEDRPTMKEVARELERIKGVGLHPWSNNSGLSRDESEYLLGETKGVTNHHSSSNKSIDGGPVSNQSGVVQLMPLNDGR
ncbi:wall-associated receptor kinase 2-like [Chenopodium quinoa]|uniref:Uncharacterized protein n=1 Tax=Chenopodium quinoa TaxID=63459 RepID=A0A803L9W8_CHEQI|nr:wall-associated receptor kinase 2-like [Chenopodium quinoa]